MSVKPPNPSIIKQQNTDIAARFLKITGRVQGVGFRPFIYNLAVKHGISGWVRNSAGYVEILCQGPANTLQTFEQQIFSEAPGFSRPQLHSSTAVTPEHVDTFIITESSAAADPDIHVPPDLSVCDACLQELNQSGDQRYRYPFINCTQCGPRFTLISSMPYDRANTSMAAFKLCENCHQQYSEPADRRFHAEPVACPVCGPELTFINNDRTATDNERALSGCVRALQSGAIVAIKGIGGYHLVCDACNDRAVLKLRQRKPRPDKPLAVLFPAKSNDDVSFVAQYVVLTEREKALLTSAERPIVLAQKRDNSTLSQYIAPALNEIGVMLPYSPLHYLLLNAFAGPLVATSANISGEPVLTDNNQVTQRLGHVADAFLHHNRPIIRPADDPVYRTIHHRPRPIRLGRGNAPLELPLPIRLERPVLAVGGHLKNNIALAWNERIVISPHIGDMDSVRSIEVFADTVRDLQSLYGVRAETVVCDAHPGYATTRWAKKCGLPVHSIFHHRAHAAAACDFNIEPVQQLIFTWDGTGYGEDGTLWGGEAMLGRPGHWQRVASLKPFRLPGGDKAGREPWRSAAALCWEINQPWPAQDNELDIIYRAWRQHINTATSSAAGRVFDAAAALTGLCANTSYEGQAPMMLETLGNGNEAVSPVQLPIYKTEDTWISDWSDLIPMLLDDTVSINRRAACFHASMAHIILQQAIVIRDDTGVSHIGFCGGVFQNRLLTDYTITLLQENGFSICYPETIPVNDAGLSYGQIIEYASLNA